MYFKKIIMIRLVTVDNYSSEDQEEKNISTMGGRERETQKEGVSMCF